MYGEITAGITPSLTSESVACAVLTATHMLQTEARPTPPPMADPFMQQMVNCGKENQSYKSRAKTSTAGATNCWV